MATIRPVRVNHMNVVLEDFDASVAHFKNVFDAEFIHDVPQREWHACLVAFGGVIFELFVPHAFLLNLRYGAHYLGVEYQADMDDVRQTIADLGLRISRDIGIAVHTHPADCFGVAFEFYSEAFHDREWKLLGRPMKPPRYWRDEHPLGLTGLKGYALVVDDLETTARFLRDFLSAEPVGADGGEMSHTRHFKVGDAVIEVIAPDAGSVHGRHLARFGQGIYSTIFGVRDLGRAKDYFQTKGITPANDEKSAGLVIPAEANLGLVFEFRE